MAKLAEPLLGIRDIGKVLSWKVAKSLIVVLVVALKLDKRFALA